MKVAVIGDIHGTTKFLECYEKIKANDNDVEKIIVMGDHFDPYTYISFETMMDRYHQFIECCKKDDRIISILGNHDLEEYVIAGGTNRTARDRNMRNAISEEIGENLPDSYLVYKIGNWLFSHAGVSQAWLDMNEEYKDELFSNKKGWSFRDLDVLCSYYDGDYSHYGSHIKQGCTWIRPDALIQSLPEGYNQVIAHTQVKKICNLKDEDPDGNIKVNVWMVDNQRKPEYLVLNIEEGE